MSVESKQKELRDLAEEYHRAAKRTPTPWRVAPTADYASGINIDARPSGVPTYVALAGTPDNEEACANADFIVQACNNFDALQRVRKAAKRLVETPEPAYALEAWAELREALKASE